MLPKVTTRVEGTIDFNWLSLYFIEDLSIYFGSSTVFYHQSGAGDHIQYPELEDYICRY